MVGGLLTSNPVRDAGKDRLGRAPFASAVARLVREHPENELIVIGIEGAWGTGKSSVLAMASADLVSDGRCREVVVSAWRAPSRDQFLANLSYGMVTALKRDWQSSYARVAWARLSRQSMPALMSIMLPILTLLLLVALPEVRVWTRTIVETKPEKLAAGLGLFGLPVLTFLFSRLSQPVLDGARAMFGAAGLEGVGALERFAHDFDVLGAGQADGSRFVVLVEDLDRCSPSQVTDVLSAIAQLSAHPRAGRLAFLLAYDRRVLLESIAQDVAKTSGGKGTPAAAEDYLFRVVHLELSLPPSTPSTGHPRPRRTPRLDAMATAFLVSVVLVGTLTWSVAAAPLSSAAAIVVSGCLVALIAEPVLGWILRTRAKVTLPDDWESAVELAETWLPPVPRHRSRVLNRARIAMLLSPDAGLTSWEAISTTVLADRWPNAFDPAALSAAVGQGTLDPTKDFFSLDFAKAYEALRTAGSPVDHFRDPAKLHAIVRWHPRSAA